MLDESGQDSNRCHEVEPTGGAVIGRATNRAKAILHLDAQSSEGVSSAHVVLGLGNPPLERIGLTGRGDTSIGTRCPFEAE